jgi:hypothetical protein
VCLRVGLEALEKRYFAPAGNRTALPRSSSSQRSHSTDCTAVVLSIDFVEIL